MDAVAKRYGQRPSQILGILDDWTAFCLDEVCALTGADEEAKAYENARQNAKGKFDTDKQWDSTASPLPVGRWEVLGEDNE